MEYVTRPSAFCDGSPAKATAKRESRHVATVLQGRFVNNQATSDVIAGEIPYDQIKFNLGEYRSRIAGAGTRFGGNVRDKMAHCPFGGHSI